MLPKLANLPIVSNTLTYQGKMKTAQNQLLEQKAVGDFFSVNLCDLFALKLNSTNISKI